MSSIFFNAHHAPVGAFATFTIGHKGASGGLGLELGDPARQNVYIGYESDMRGTFNALPFFEDRGSHHELFGLTESVDGSKGKVPIRPFPDESIHRDFSVCADSWVAGRLRFTIYNQAPLLPDPEDAKAANVLKRMLFPGVIAELEIDNRSSRVVRTALLGFTGNDPYSGMRGIHTGPGGISGIGQGRHLAIYTDAPSAQPGIGFSTEDILSAASRGNVQSGLGNAALLLFNVPAGERAVFRFAVCLFREGVPAAGCEGKYWYRRYFASIDETGIYALNHFDAIKASAEADSRRLADHRLSPERSFMLAHAVKSYYGSTQLLDAPDGPLWIVNEGEYRMINTLDLTVDHLFFELTMHPWTIRNVLDRYARDYSYEDCAAGPDGVVSPGGITFTHDMGVANVFAPHGCSAYELPGISGCFSYMTHEELVNWVLCAAMYVLRIADNNWLGLRNELLAACLQSLINRDHPEEGMRRGTMCRDSSMVQGGSEITTYDSLDPSLGRARANGYVTVKRWAAFVLLHRLFEQSGNTDAAATALREAHRAARLITGSVGSDGTIPALLDGTSSARAFPLIEGLIYPWFAGCREIFETQSSFAPFIAVLRSHVAAVISSGICRYEDKGLKLSSSSDITWLSKLYLCRFIATDVLGIVVDDTFVNADKTHVQWLLDEKNSFYAWSDQFRNGEIVGSRYYPRGVTAVLWLSEKE